MQTQGCNQDAMMAKHDICTVIILHLRHWTTTSRYHSLIDQLHIVNIIYTLLSGRTLAHFRNLSGLLRRQEARDGYSESIQKLLSGALPHALYIWLCSKR